MYINGDVFFCLQGFHLNQINIIFSDRQLIIYNIITDCSWDIQEYLSDFIGYWGEVKVTVSLFTMENMREFDLDCVRYTDEQENLFKYFFCNTCIVFTFTETCRLTQRHLDEEVEIIKTHVKLHYVFESHLYSFKRYCCFFFRWNTDQS